MLSCAILAGAQTPARDAPSVNPRDFHLPYLGLRLTLGPDWLFAAGDNPAYASPTYDDSGWRTISVEKPLSSYGVRDISYGWYRLHVRVSPKARHLLMEVQYIEGSYELYVNGVRLGANGKMNGLLRSSQDYLASYDIPNSMIAPNGDLVVAIRFALNKVGPGGSGTSTPFHFGSILLAVGDAAQRDVSYEASHQTAIPLMLFGLSLLVGLVALALYIAMRNRVEYLAIAISLLGDSVQLGVIVWAHLHAFTVGADFLQTLALAIGNVALIEFVRLILHLRRSRWLLALEIANFVGYFGANLANLGFVSILQGQIAYFAPTLIVQAVLPVLLLLGMLRGNRDTYVVLPAITVVSVANYWNFLLVFTGLLHLPLRVPQLPYISVGTYGINFWAIWGAIYCVTMLLFLVLRTIGIARERARAAAELEAARIVQHVLIPEEIPAVPGFVLESVYKPAGEVGGDFFQIVALKDGGVLAVIGDVSGKGMPAAMTVSLLVGTFRTLAHYTQEPGEILAAMNARMLARSHGGFTTCLVLRADADGRLTIANAGHIAPYLAGEELPVENGLPLGLAAAATYAESTFQLAPGQQVTLVTDGVVEARDKSGAIFGFKRTAILSVESAEAIARAAQDFGQDDDITALTRISHERLCICLL